LKYLKRTIIFFIFFILIHIEIFANEPEICSPSAILINSNTGEVLYEKNSNSLMFPASTTKILTAIIAIEHCSLDTKIKASENAITSIKKGYTNANIQVDEELSLEDLLYALLLSSANEAANVIAEYIGGTIENFANMMTSKAIELSCFNTHFTNANGIHDDNHFTTASDLAKIARYCMQNKTFRKIICTKEYTLPSTPQYPENDRILRNTNSLMSEQSAYYYPYVIAGKTGFTTQAKNCLVAVSQKDGLELISVVLHAEATEDGRSARYLDTINLLEYGNTNYAIPPQPEIQENTSINESSEEFQNENKKNIHFSLFIYILLILLLIRILFFIISKIINHFKKENMF